MAKAKESDKGEKGGKVVLEEQPQQRADRGRVRSKEDEEALDRKIAEIRKKNQLIEQRKELVEEDRANFVSEYGKVGLYSRSKWLVGKKKRNSKPAKARKIGEWDREWDAGKTSVEKWKENVPDIDKNTKPGAHFPRGPKNRGCSFTKTNTYKNNSSSNNKSNNNNDSSRKVFVGINEKRKFEQAKFTVFIETNKKLPDKKVLCKIVSNKKTTNFAATPSSKLLEGKNPKNVNGSGWGVPLRNTHLAALTTLSSLKPPCVPFSRRPNGQPFRNYKKPSYGFSKRYSSRRVAPTTTRSIATSTAIAVTEQKLDTVKVNVSTLGLKEDTDVIIKNNNSNDKSTEKLTAVVCGGVATAPPISREHENNDNVVAEDIKEIVEEMLLQIK